MSTSCECSRKYELKKYTHLQLLLHLADGADGQQERPGEKRADVQHRVRAAASQAGVLLLEVGLAEDVFQTFQGGVQLLVQERRE